MTPKEKAEELVDKYINLYPSYIVMFKGDLDKAQKDIKQCAIIAVDEIIKETKLHDKTIFEHNRTNFWQEVKQEIKNL